jgi:hypothetical protein
LSTKCEGKSYISECSINITPNTVICDRFIINLLCCIFLKNSFSEIGVNPVLDIKNIHLSLDEAKICKFSYKFTEPDVDGILIQLFVLFSEFKKLNFTHGTPNIKSLYFTKEPISYKYNISDNKFILLICDFTLKIDNFNRSSFFYDKEVIFDSITNRKNSNHFEFYCFMVSIMCTYFNSKLLSDIWTLMWDDQVTLIELNDRYITRPDLLIKNFEIKENILDIVANLF